MANKLKFWNGNSYDRRKFRRWMNRNVLPLIDDNVPLAQVAKQTGVTFQALMKHLQNEGYTRAGWMYVKPTKPSNIYIKTQDLVA